MERGLSLLIATVILFVASGVQAQNNLSFANNTQLNITRMGCGVTKLCVETPSQCDPAGNSTCLFTSVIAGNASAPNGTTLSFELSGNSTGYIALGLTVNASQGIPALFICGQNSSTNGTFFFSTKQKINSTSGLSPSMITVTAIQGKINGNKIQCGFTVPSLNATAMTRIDSSTIFTILLGSGSVNGSSLGDFMVTLNSGPLNIANASANVAATTAAPSTTMTTRGAGVTLHTHAVTLLLSVLALCVLMMA